MIVRIGRTDLECVTLLQISKIVKRRPMTLRHLEKNNVLPPSNLRGKDIVLKNNTVRAGQRLYSLELALSLAPIFREWEQGTKITDEVKVKILTLFKHEKSKLTEYAKN